MFKCYGCAVVCAYRLPSYYYYHQDIDPRQLRTKPTHNPYHSSLYTRRKDKYDHSRYYFNEVQTTLNLCILVTCASANRYVGDRNFFSTCNTPVLTHFEYASSREIDSASWSEHDFRETVDFTVAPKCFRFRWQPFNTPTIIHTNGHN